MCAVDPGSPLVTRFLARHRQGVAAAYPALAAGDLVGTSAFLIMNEDEVVGLFAMVGHDGEGRVLLDYVTDRFRDLRPGRALYADQALTLEGISRLVVDPGAVTDAAYFEKVGFTRHGGMLVKALAGSLG